jgi:hypothetical protein
MLEFGRWAESVAGSKAKACFLHGVLRGVVLRCGRITYASD